MDPSFLLISAMENPEWMGTFTGPSDQFGVIVRRGSAGFELIRSKDQFVDLPEVIREARCHRGGFALYPLPRPVKGAHGARQPAVVTVDLQNRNGPLVE